MLYTIIPKECTRVTHKVKYVQCKYSCVYMFSSATKTNSEMKQTVYLKKKAKKKPFYSFFFQVRKTRLLTDS